MIRTTKYKKIIFIFVNGIAKWKTNVSLSLLHYNISHLRWKAHLMYYNNNSWTMLRYACYEPLHVPHLSLFILGLHPFPFFSLQTRDKLSCSTKRKVYWKWELLQTLHEKGIPSIFPPHYFEKEVLFCEALFSSVLSLLFFSMSSEVLEKGVEVFFLL